MWQRTNVRTLPVCYFGGARSKGFATLRNVSKLTFFDKIGQAKSVGFRFYLACSRLRDGGGKSFSNKKCEKRAGAGETCSRLRDGGGKRAGSCASYFRFARFNTFPLYYLRAWHRLGYIRLFDEVRAELVRDISRSLRFL